MERDVGHFANDPYIYRNRYGQQFVAKKQLSSNVVEEEYVGGRRCKVFFQIDTTANKVVGWRFEGAEDDCWVAL